MPWLRGIQGGFALHSEVVEVMPKGTEVVSAEAWGLSAWTKTAKICTILPGGDPQRYFIKCATGKLAKIHMWGEHYAATVISTNAPGINPRPVGVGEYFDEAGRHVCFYLQEFHDMDLQSAPDPTGLATSIAELHQNTTSPNGMFGYPIINGRGTQDRTEHWSRSWALQFTYLLKDLIKLDNQVNVPWPEYDTACRQLIEGVIPRLLGALQSEGREITPVFCHGNLWEGNVATDMETGKVIVFDADESMYGHNEIEFGTWRCSWASHFKSPVYVREYQMEIEPSEPAEEWDDRNRLYAIKAAICDSAGHCGSRSRIIAYNDMLYLCEKYAPLESLERYDPAQDLSVPGVLEPYGMV